MATFQILPGLPSSGPPAQPFPPDFGRLGREGLVVEIIPPRAPSWVGNFSRGLSSFSAVYQHPDGERLFVVAGGHGYVVDSATRSIVNEVGAAITGVWPLSSPPSLLLDHQGIAFERIGPEGRLWHTRRLSWDGFKELNITPDTISGLGWRASGDTWEPFTVDLRTGRTRGGAYRGPDVTDGEVLADCDGSAA